MEKIIELLLTGNYTGILIVGLIFMLFMSGIMALVFIKYVFKIMGNLENVKEIKPLIEKVEKLVDEIHTLVTSHEVSREVTQVEIENIKEQIKDIYARLSEIEKKGT